jgi:hypothetical protein
MEIIIKGNTEMLFKFGGWLLCPATHTTERVTAGEVTDILS